MTNLRDSLRMMPALSTILWVMAGVGIGLLAVVLGVVVSIVYYGGILQHVPLLAR
ncbi:MAG: hypothetical protein ACXV5U_04580 [Ilumatobacteraceae bacterium]